MKQTETKLQEMVNKLFGYGQFIVTKDKEEQLLEHFSRFLPQLTDASDVILAFLRGEVLSKYAIQRKFHALRNLRVSIKLHPEFAPDFLERVELSEQQWTLSMLSQVFFGGNEAQIRRLDLPEPANGETYSTDEVKNIIEELDGTN